MSGFLSAGIVGGPDIPDSGVARWTLDDADTDGSTAIDSWGNHNGTIDGATTGVSGANQTYDTNEAYSFGGNDVVDAGTGVLDSTQEFSVAFWVKFDFLNNDSQRIVNTNDNENGFSFFNINGDGLEFRTEDSGDRHNVQIPLPNTDTWLHYVCVYDGSDNIVYEDASDVGSTSSNGSGGDPVPFEVGGWSSGGEYIEGDVDDVRIYDKGLSPSEVSNLYNTGSIDG